MGPDHVVGEIEAPRPCNTTPGVREPIPASVPTNQRVGFRSRRSGDRSSTGRAAPKRCSSLSSPGTLVKNNPANAGGPLLVERRSDPCVKV